MIDEKQNLICPECGTKLKLSYTYSNARDGIITTTRRYMCQNEMCGYQTTRFNTKNIG